MKEWNTENFIHDDKLKLSVYLSVCMQAEFSSRNQILQTVNTNLFEEEDMRINWRHLSVAENHHELRHWSLSGRSMAHLKLDFNEILKRALLLIFVDKF